MDQSTTKEEKAWRAKEAVRIARQVLQPGDRIRVSKCPGTKRYITFAGWDGQWIVSKSGINDYHPINVDIVNGEQVNFHNTGFDIDEWRETCKRLADTAMLGCGLSHDVFVRSFSGDVELLLPAIGSQSMYVAIKVAREYGYEKIDQINDQANWNAEHGYCPHGIDKNCCPAGCGDV